jgi:N-acetylglucosaminyl-diphospho-decaprenol L-rhamnosyltransferase
VDPGSRDESVAVARSLGVNVIVTENRGLGHLYNRGVAETDADFVLVANPDTAFAPDCVELLVAALAVSPSRFAADPTQLDWSGREVLHARTLLSRGTLHDPIPGLHLDGAVPATDVVPTLAANAGGMLVRRTQLLELGGFDEGFFLEYEDLDLCWRAWRHGWESVYVPRAVMRHRVGAATPVAAAPRRLAASHASVLRFALKHLPAGLAAFVVAVEVLRLIRRPRVVAPGLARTIASSRSLAAVRHPSRELLDKLIQLRA